MLTLLESLNRVGRILASALYCCYIISENKYCIDNFLEGYTVAQTNNLCYTDTVCSPMWYCLFCCERDVKYPLILDSTIQFIVDDGEGNSFTEGF